MNNSGDYVLYTTLLLLSRGVDLLSTWQVTPNLILELNQWMRRVGWKWAVIINIVFSFCFPLIFSKNLVLRLVTFFVLLALRNYMLMPCAVALGEYKYSEVLKEYYLNTRNIRFWPSVIIKCIIVQMLAIVTIIAGIANTRFQFTNDVASGIIFYGVVVLFIEIGLRYKYRSSH
jgi:hypothetical protein